MMKRLVHFILKASTKRVHQDFLLKKNKLEEIQRTILKDLLLASSATEFGKKKGINPNLSYEDLVKLLPISNWMDWKDLIEDQKKTGRAVISQQVNRYQPTSGSSSKTKWIPYNQLFLKQIDLASMTWLHDLYRLYPNIAKGSHYWSLSWLPNELRSQVTNSDLNSLTWTKRHLLNSVMAVPDEVQMAPTSEACQFATMAWLIARSDLSFIFIWSPTFILSLWENILKNKAGLVKTLRTGQWAQCSHELEKIPVPQHLGQSLKLAEVNTIKSLIVQVWPNLTLISCWNTADARFWSDQFSKLCPQIPIQGKGLFATEGVVTIPVDGKYHLSYQSHFYEFETTEKLIIPAWKLVQGMKVSPVLSTGNGLWRYRLGDWMMVEEIVDGCPILKFLGREATVDLVGEKLTFDVASKIISNLKQTYQDLSKISFLASSKGEEGKAQYILLCEGASPHQLATWVENELMTHYHYQVARELNQLSPLKVKVVDDQMRYFERMCEEYNWIKGNMKWETIIRVPFVVE